MAARPWTLLLLCAAMMPALAGCPSGGSGTGASPSATSEGGTTSGNALTIKGSDTILPLSQKWAEQFKQKNPSADVSVSGGGSGQGITALINGTTEIANSSREIKDEEKELAKQKGIEVVETAVARDGITIVVNPANPVKSLTLEQLKNIYTGKTNNWSEIVPGYSEKIVASGRDTASGTYGYFQEEVLDKEDYRADMISNPSNNAIAQDVTKSRGGVGYIGVAYATEFTKTKQVKEVPVSFRPGDAPILPTSDNIQSGKYPISRALYNYTAGAPKGLAKEYIDFVTGPEGQKIVTEEGYVALTAGGEAGAPPAAGAASPEAAASPAAPSSGH